MKITLTEDLKYSQKSIYFEKNGDIFWINRKFIKRSKKEIFVQFPEWATQIYVKHNDMMYQIFLHDFEQFMENQVPIPFHLHFPKKPISKNSIPIAKNPKSIFPNSIVEPFHHISNLEPTHDEIILAKRSGEIA